MHDDDAFLRFLSDPAAPLPPRIPLEEAVTQIATIHERNEGATFNMYFGDLAGKPLFAVGADPRRVRRIAGRIVSREHLRKFIEDNDDLLRYPRYNVGTWFNATDGLTYLDISLTIAERQQAVDIARQHNETAIYDLRRGESIDIAEEPDNG